MKLSLARDVTVTPIDSGAVILDGRRGHYWQLNQSGYTILGKLLAGDEPEVAAASLSAAAPVSDAQARQDVMALIDALSSANLLEVSR
jgi:hypothetical protein